MNLADQVQLCRAVLLEVQTGGGQPGGPINVDGCDMATVNATVRIMVEEGLLTGLPPGDRYPDVWSATSITYAGLEFLEAYRTEQDADNALRQVTASRRRSDTMVEFVSMLAKAMHLLGP